VRKGGGDFVATPLLIIGKSGAGKSTSMRNCAGNEDWNLIRVLNKPLPFRGKINGWPTDNYEMVKKCLAKSKAHNIVIDDAGYLITNAFMAGHSNTGTGNAQFVFYNKLADQFWDLVQFIINKLPIEKIVYVMMHEEQDDFGNIKPKTIGKLLDQKVCIEGMFTIVLRAVADNQGHAFITQAEDMAVSKSPMGMFETERIDNDLILVEKAIRDYYEIPVPVAGEGS
jgi:hypothetical protein